MKNRPADIEYEGLNIDKEKVKSAKPTLNEKNFIEHHTYIFERHKIWVKKEVKKLPSPWTDDEIFKKYKFTNVRRELDRESLWLINNISKNANLTLEEKILFSLLFRIYNKGDTFEALNIIEDLPILEFGEDGINEFREKGNKFLEENPDFLFFTSAFLTSGIKRAWGYPKHFMKSENLTEEEKRTIYEVVDTDGNIIKKTSFQEAFTMTKNDDNLIIKDCEDSMLARGLWLLSYARDKIKVHSKIVEANSATEVFEILQEVRGLSKFLAYQIFVDLTYIKDFKFSENEFTVSGPGCNWGLDFVFETKDGLNYEELLFWLKDNIVDLWKERGLEYDLEKLFEDLPEDDRNMNVMLLENSFCETSKRIRIIENPKNPRKIYRPTKKEFAKCIINEF